VNAPGQHSYLSRTGSVLLQPGLHDFQLQYFQIATLDGQGGLGLQVGTQRRC